MVATQLLLMNHFLMSLSHNSADLNAFHNINSVAVDSGECSYGCTKCSPINGCLACKPPFFLLLHREGIRQTASCTRSCPKGFYKLKKKRNGFCAKCTMRGCVDCLDSRYCSSCDTSYVNFFGKCIKPRSGEAREDLGLYTTTRRPSQYSTSEIGVTTEANRSSLSSEDSSFMSSTVTPIAPSTVETFAITQRTNSSFHTTAVAPLSPPVTETTARTTSTVLDQSKTSPSSTPVTPPGIATRFYFTTPTSPLLSDKFSSGISPYPSRTTVGERKPCRSKSNRRPGRLRGDRKYKKRRKGRKKNHKDRKYRRRRRKGRRGQKQRRRSCRRKEKNRRKNDKTSRITAGGFQPTPPSQDPVMRQMNSAEPRDELNGKFSLNQGKVSGVGTSNSDRTVDDLKVSLLEETDRLSPPNKGHDGWPKDLARHFQNRPGTMVAFKTSLALRNKKKKKKETGPFYHNGHRLRHGRSRVIPSRSSSGGELSLLDRNPRTKSGQRRRRRIDRRPRKRSGKVSSPRTL